MSQSVSEDLYQVQAIEGKRELRGKVYYQVHWKGYSKEHNSWEPEENLVSCDALIKDYERTLSTKNKTAGKSEIPKVSVIKDEVSGDDEISVEILAKPRRGRPSKHMKDSKTKLKSASTTTAPGTPQSAKEIDNRYNLRSTTKKIVEPRDENHDLLLPTSTNSTTEQSSIHLADFPTIQTCHDAHPKPESDFSTSEISQVKTRLELQFDSKESQTQPVSSTPDKSKTEECSILQASQSQINVSQGATTSAETCTVVLHKKGPSHIGSAEYFIALCIVFVGILGYVLTAR